MKRLFHKDMIICCLLYAVITAVQFSLYSYLATSPSDFYFLPEFCYEHDVSVVLLYVILWLLERLLIGYLNHLGNERFLRERAIYRIVRGQKACAIQMYLLKQNLKENLVLTVIRSAGTLLLGKYELLAILPAALGYFGEITLLSQLLLNIYLLLNSQIAFPVYAIVLLSSVVLFQKAVYSFFINAHHLKGEAFILFVSRPGFIAGAVITAALVMLTEWALLKRRDY